MFKALFYTHLISVNFFILIYLVKTVLLLANKKEALAMLTRAVKVPEMIVSALFLLTGIYLMTQVPEIKTLLIIKIIVVLASIPIAVIGFKKGNKALALLSFVMIVAAYGLAEMSKKQTTAASSATGGQQLYAENCSRCHGDDGRLGLTGATDLSASSLDKPAKAEIIKTGKGTMPAFGASLDEQQINALAAYVESLKK